MSDGNESDASTETVVNQSTSENTKSAKMDQNNGSHQPESEDEAHIGSVRTIKLPQPFWRDMPSRWFTVAEASFALNKITSDTTRFRYVILNLDSEMLNVVGDIIDNPPATDKYKTMKERIISSFGESSEARLRRLLRGQPMGDEKPSVYLQRLRNLAGGQCNDHVIRSLFLEQLSDTTRGILAVNEACELNVLAAQSDRIYEAMPKNNIHVVNEHTTPHVKQAHTNFGEPSTARDDGRIEMLELRAAVQALTKELRESRTSQRNRSKSRNRDSSSSSHDAQTGLCYFHNRFGNKARKCREPCTWSPKN